MSTSSQNSASGSVQRNRLLLGFIPPSVLRVMIGIFGMALPTILVVGNNFVIMGSISSYYYTPMKWWFVGYFILLGWMLIAYKGFPGTHDDAASIIAGVAAIGLGVFRTSPPNTTRDLIGWIHVLFTLIFFIMLTYMSGWDFTSTTTIKWKKFIYRLGAFLMIVAMLGITLFEVLALKSIEPFENPTFYLEVLAFESFGVSWIIRSS